MTDYLLRRHTAHQVMEWVEECETLGDVKSLKLTSTENLWDGAGK